MKLLALAVLPFMAACASTGEEASIAPRPHPRLAKAGLLPGSSIPAEREGIQAEDTGAIMFVCADSPRHGDKEVFISKCPACSEQNYFYWDPAGVRFVCYACTRAVETSVVKCPDCGRPPRVVRTRPSPIK